MAHVVRSTATRRLISGVVFSALLVLPACSSEPDAPETETETTSAASFSSDQPISAEVGVPVPVSWIGARSGTGTITVNSFSWRQNPALSASRAPSLVADVTVVVETGTGEVDPNYWTAYLPSDSQGVTGGLETSSFEGGMVAVPIAAGSTAQGVVAWAVDEVSPITVSVVSGLSSIVSWTVLADAPVESAVTDPTGSVPEPTALESSTASVPAISEVPPTATELPSEPSAPTGEPADSAAGTPPSPSLDGSPVDAGPSPAGATVETVAEILACGAVNVSAAPPVGSLAYGDCELDDARVQIFEFADRESGLPLIENAVAIGTSPGQLIWFGNFLIDPDNPEDVSRIVSALG